MKKLYHDEIENAIETLWINHEADNDEAREWIEELLDEENDLYEG